MEWTTINYGYGMDYEMDYNYGTDYKMEWNNLLLKICNAVVWKGVGGQRILS